MKIKRDNVKRWAALGLALATAVAALAACGGSGTKTADTTAAAAAGGETTAAAAAAEKPTVIFASQPENGEYDPSGATAYVYFDYQTNCLEGLIDYNEQGGYEPAAAESWEANDDGTVWTFHLREDGYWSDGSKVTSADFLNTIKRALDPAKGSWYVDGLFVIKGTEDAFNETASVDDIGVECPDDYTLVFHLNAPCAYFLDYLRLPTYMPSNVKYASNENVGWDQDPAQNLGNGPYHMAAHEPGESITYTLNPYYRKQPAFGTIVLKFMADEQAMVSAYKTGEVDVYGNAPYYILEQYAGKPDLDESPVMVTNYVLFNINQAPFDDVRVREAFSLAVSRQGIIDVIGSNHTTDTSFIPATFPSKANTGKTWGDLAGILLEENAAKAQQLLADAGYPGGAGLPELTYTYPSMGNEADVAQTLQQQWKEVLGADVKLNAMEYEVYVDERRAGKLQFARMQWTGDFLDPATWLDMYRTGNAQNDVDWSNSEYDSIMTASMSEMDPAKREEMLLEAERILVTEDHIICPLFNSSYIYLINPKLTGHWNHPLGGKIWKDAVVVQ
ncbi:MAG: peptide ABC transporter substrate-binding protein [Lachnospiraceae bacterium]|jgi:oligopeptide transport system substrate-binding protein|nr:peptide ABC transporter substrate-binding protein [Lachnospiraceae bacterium]